MPMFYFDFGGGFVPEDEGCEFDGPDQANHAGVASMLREASERPSKVMAENATLVVRDQYRNECIYTLSVTRFVTP